MRTPQQTIRNALEQYRGDNLARARMAFRGFSPEEMAKQYGKSGKTCAELLAGHEEHEAEVNEALAWLMEGRQDG